MPNKVRAVLHGALQGLIWMPSAVYTKDVRVDLTRERERLTPARRSLHYLIDRVCADGDFRSAKLQDWSFIELTTWRTDKSGNTVKRSKSIKLTKFKCIQDYLIEEAF